MITLLMVKAKIQINKKKTRNADKFEMQLKQFQLISLHRKRKMMLKLKSIHIFALEKYKNTIIA